VRKRLLHDDGSFRLKAEHLIFRLKAEATEALGMRRWDSAATGRVTRVSGTVKHLIGWYFR